jgi:hypothetical protein
MLKRAVFYLATEGSVAVWHGASHWTTVHGNAQIGQVRILLLDADEKFRAESAAQWCLRHIAIDDLMGQKSRCACQNALSVKRHLGKKAEVELAEVVQTSAQLGISLNERIGSS